MDLVNAEDEHQGFLKEGDGGDRMGPWLSLHEEMFWMVINLEGIEQEKGLRAQSNRVAGCGLRDGNTVAKQQESLWEHGVRVT